MWIESIKVEGGILDKFEQGFSPELNVLIGGRGTGKSSVIELIRFCLGARSYSEEEAQRSAEHALGVLGDGKVTITLTDGKQRFEVSRTAQDTENPDADIFDAPFVFSQSEIESVGLHSPSRLRLIDDFLTHRPDTAGPDAGVASKIRSATTEIRTLLAEIDDIAEKALELPKLKAQLEVLKAQSTAQTKVHQEIQVFRKSLAEVTPLVASARVRSEALSRAVDRFGGWVAQLDELLDAKPSFEAWPAQAGSDDELGELRKKEKQVYGRIHAGLEDLKTIVEELSRKRTAAQNQRVGLENRARDVRQKIEEKQKGASALDKQISDLTQQISVLTSLVDLREQRVRRVKSLTEQRGKLLSQYESQRQQRTKAREKITQALNSALGPAVRVGILPFAQHLEYSSVLSGVLRGSGLRYAELSERIAQTFSPSEIAIKAETQDIEGVASALDISEDRARRLCDALRTTSGTSLFTTSVEDDVQIELMDGMDYKGIDFLSMGQRCTVILPIILRHTERMIILDQPEDHLDNAFVVGTLIKGIVARSQSAQTIVATHNPNIPVLGDASLVIHMDSDGSRCFVRESGPIDMAQIVTAITTIMEGGREAFLRRAEFYAKTLPNVSK